MLTCDRFLLVFHRYEMEVAGGEIPLRIRFSWVMLSIDQPEASLCSGAFQLRALRRSFYRSSEGDYRILCIFPQEEPKCFEAPRLTLIVASYPELPSFQSSNKGFENCLDKFPNSIDGKCSVQSVGTGASMITHEASFGCLKARWAA